jgi:hypothetical protein
MSLLSPSEKLTMFVDVVPVALNLSARFSGHPEVRDHGLHFHILHNPAQVSKLTTS